MTSDRLSSTGAAAALTWLLSQSQADRLPTSAQYLVYIAFWVSRWVERSQTRRQLRELGPDQLRDIGLTSEQARREAEKLFWRR